VTEALFALLGVLVGSLLTYYLSLQVEKSRWEREDKNRWIRDKRDIYARYIASAHMAASRGSSLGLLLRKGTAPNNLPQQYDEYSSSNFQALAELRMLGPESVMQPAEEIVKLLQQISGKIGTGITQKEADDFAAQFKPLRNLFLEEVRKDLGAD